MIEKIALRYVRAKKIGLFEFRYWAMFAVFNLLDDEQFEQFVGVADDMGLMFASELVTALHDEPLGALMKRRAESGGAPVSVLHSHTAAWKYKASRSSVIQLASYAKRSTKNDGEPPGLPRLERPS